MYNFLPKLHNAVICNLCVDHHYFTDICNNVATTFICCWHQLYVNHQLFLNMLCLHMHIKCPFMQQHIGLYHNFTQV